MKLICHFVNELPIIQNFQNHASTVKPNNKKTTFLSNFFFASLQLFICYANMIYRYQSLTLADYWHSP